MPNSNDFAITHDKCKSCDNLLNIDQIDPDYEGQLATYANDKCCTLDCLTSSEEETTQLQK